MELSGRITDAVSRRPLGGATVRFTSDTLYTAQTRSDADGHYEMVVETDVPLGQVRAERAGYQPAEATVFFDTPQRRVDLALRPIAPAEPEP